MTLRHYPFGLKQRGYNNTIQGGNDLAQSWKYNGKQFNQELGVDWYDYGWRNYDASIGRWMNLDPMAEKYYDLTLYNYAVNNPIFFIDPDGREVDVSELEKSKKVEDQWLLFGLMMSLSEMSGQKITKSTDNNTKTTLIGDGCQGECQSESVSSYIDHLLDPTSGTIIVKSVTDGTKANPAGELHLDATQIKNFQESAKEVGIDEKNVTIGIFFLHETLHTKVGADYFNSSKDKADKNRFGGFSDPLTPELEKTTPGPTTSRVNLFRKELGLPIRYIYNDGKGTLSLKYKDGKTVEVPPAPSNK